MTAKELINRLEKCNPNSVVVLTEPDKIGWDNIGTVSENGSIVFISMDGDGIFHES